MQTLRSITQALVSADEGFVKALPSPVPSDGGLLWVETDAGRAASDWPHVELDCGVRAIARVVNLSYGGARRGLEASFSGRTNESVERAIRRTTLSRFLGSDWWYDGRLINGRRRRFVRQDLPMDEHIIVFVRDHFCAVVNGTIYDEADWSGTDVLLNGIFRRRQPWPREGKPSEVKTT